jgi:hypothetical protein
MSMTITERRLVSFVASQVWWEPKPGITTQTELIIPNLQGPQVEQIQSQFLNSP